MRTGRAASCTNTLRVASGFRPASTESALFTTINNRDSWMIRQEVVQSGYRGTYGNDDISPGCASAAYRVFKNGLITD